MNNLTSGRSFPFRNGDERAPAAPVLFPRLLWLWPVRNHITFPLIILFFLVIFFISSFSYTLSLILPDENIFFVIINTFVLPIFFVSTALIPYESISSSYKTVVLLNPFTHVINSVRNIILENTTDWGIFINSAGIMLVLCILSFVLSVYYLNKSSNNI